MSNAALLEGKVALVTGGAGGIGQAACQRFAKAGAKVVVADLLQKDVDRAVAAVESNGGKAVGVTVDVSNPQSVAAMVESAVSAFGRLDCAFNNAGIQQEHGPHLTQQQRETIWNRVIAVNLTGIWLSMQYEIAQFRRQGGGGAIVNCSSVGGFRAIPPQDIYAASKHGVIGTTRATAVECAPLGIRINAVAPGGVDTPMIQRELDKLPKEHVQAARDGIAALHPMGRVARPEEVANAVVWLCSDEASFTTGEVLAVDGGWLAR